MPVDPEQVLGKIRKLIWDDWANGPADKSLDYKEWGEKLANLFIVLDNHLSDKGELPHDWMHAHPGIVRPASHREATRKLINEGAAVYNLDGAQRLLRHLQNPTLAEKYPDRD